MKKPHPEDLIGYILAGIVLIAFAIGILIIAFDYAEKVHASEFVGCALSVNCPQGIVDNYYKNGGVPYYSTFPQGSKEYWHSYCTLLPNKCG
tara:strand:+ start:1614 stop:1889 length:276 start_codon:yes stop_codon:yes gene_type:complete